MFTIEPALHETLFKLRAHYILEMQCHIVYEALYRRRDYIDSFIIARHGTPVGFASIAFAGPWSGTRTVFEFYLFPEVRSQMRNVFQLFQSKSGATHIQAQSNDTVCSTILYLEGVDVTPELVIFEGWNVSTLQLFNGATCRSAREGERTSLYSKPNDAQPQLIIEVKDRTVAAGGLATHFLKPFNEIFMRVDSSYRNQGIGSYLVQELANLCTNRGCIPAAHCKVGNVPSQRALAKGGLVSKAIVLKAKLPLA